MQFGHEPVLLQETIDSLALKPGEVYVDCTVGAAGHSLGMLATEPAIKLIGIDQDAAALERAQYRLATFARQVTLIAGQLPPPGEPTARAGSDRGGRRPR